MSEKKVLFHTLERLDLIDIEALQELVLEYLGSVVGNIVGRHQTNTTRVGCMLANPLTVAINNGTGGAYTISFGDFTYLESVADNRSRKSRVILYDADASFNEVCDFAYVRGITQVYYDANSRLPEYGPSANDAFYPYVWAKTTQVDALTDTRRFWSVANGIESTSVVATRSDRATNFSIGYTEPAGGPWTPIARITAWALNGSVVELQPAGITYLGLADSLFPLPLQGEEQPYHAQDYSGIYACFDAVREELLRIRSGGTEDGVYGSTLTKLGSNPSLSLDGLYDRTEQLQYMRLLGSAVFTSETNRSAGTHNIEVRNNYMSSDFPRVTLNSNPDYTLLFGKPSAPPAPLDFAGTFFNPNTQDTFYGNWIAALSMLTVEVPSAYEGREIRVNPVVVAAVFDDYDSLTYDRMLGNVDSISAATRFESFAPVTAMLVTQFPSGDTNYSDVLRVSELTRKNENNENVTFHGVKIGLGGLGFLSRTELAFNVCRISVKVDVELVEIDQ